ncbi:MAG: hypothetical protein SGI84_00920 [Gemmatimonadota bacterium]|nr:hypothetical protein [Gemmatimonadota bacterium]
MPELTDRRHAARLSYDELRTARLRLQGFECTVLDVGREGVRYELPALPVRPATDLQFEGELELVCGDRVPVMGTVVRTYGCVAAAHLDNSTLSDLQLSREREFVRQMLRSRERSEDRRRWRSPIEPMSPHEPRRSEA